ncbi:unnamed protein product, partial [Meganyctiphanes norvegica]
LLVNFIINLKAWRKVGGMEDLIEKGTREKTSGKSKLIFTILEDTPQLILHSMFIVNSVLGHDNPTFYAGIDMLHIGSYLGVISSAASIALTLTLFNMASSYKASFIQFSATFVSVGTRAMVCASYTTIVIYTSGPLTWALVLPPVTVIALFIIEYGVIFIYNCLLNFR